MQWRIFLEVIILGQFLSFSYSLWLAWSKDVEQQHCWVSAIAT